jgi:hypothetical protein
MAVLKIQSQARGNSHCDIEDLLAQQASPLAERMPSPFPKCHFNLPHNGPLRAILASHHRAAPKLNPQRKHGHSAGLSIG